MWAEFFSELKRLNPRLKTIYHSDGVIDPIIPDMIEVGLDVLNPIQPACMDPAALKKQFGDKLCFWGSIDQQHTLPFGKPDDVRREVLTRLDTIGKGGGLIIGPTHHVQLDTPMENFWARVDTIKAWHGTPRGTRNRPGRVIPMNTIKLKERSAYPLTSALLIMATSWSLGLAAPAPAPADFWVRDKPGRITHACSEREPLVICLQGRKVVMQVQSDLTNGFTYTARFFNLLSDVEEKKVPFEGERESSPEAVITNLKGVRL